MQEYQGFGKIPRFNREVVVTEKIDGTNGQIEIRPVWSDRTADFSDMETTAARDFDGLGTYIRAGRQLFLVKAGSRNRWLSYNGQDNHGFASWVKDNALTLTADLGEGQHYGEWYGLGIGRGYGLTEKRFMLFNTARWGASIFRTPNLESSTVLFEGTMKDLMSPEEDITGYTSETHLDFLVENLRVWGSHHIRGFMNAEGIIIYHKAANSLFKMTLKNDDTPKAKVAE